MVGGLSASNLLQHTPGGPVGGEGPQRGHARVGEQAQHLAVAAPLVRAAAKLQGQQVAGRAAEAQAAPEEHVAAQVVA